MNSIELNTGILHRLIVSSLLLVATIPVNLLPEHRLIVISFLGSIGISLLIKNNKISFINTSNLALSGFALFSFLSIGWSCNPSLALFGSFTFLLFSSLFSYISIIVKHFNLSYFLRTSFVTIFYSFTFLYSIEFTFSLDFIHLNNNNKAAYLLLLLPFVCFYDRVGFSLKFFSILLCLLISIALKAKACIMAFIIFGLIFFAHRILDSRRTIILGLVFSFVIPIILSLTNLSQSDSFLVRKFQFFDSIDTFTDQPLVGYGSGSWYNYAYEKDLTEFPLRFKSIFKKRVGVHSLWLKTLVELGVIGFLTLLLFYTFPLILLSKSSCITNTFQLSCYFSLIIFMVFSHIYRCSFSYEGSFSGLQTLSILIVAGLSSKLFPNKTEKRKVYHFVLLLSCVLSFIYFIWYNNIQNIINELKNQSDCGIEEVYNTNYLNSYRYSNPIEQVIINCYMSKNDYLSRMKYNQLGVRNNPTNDRLLLNLAYDYLYLKNDFEKSKYYADKISNRFPNYNTIELFYAEYYYLNKNWEQLYYVLTNYSGGYNPKIKYLKSKLICSTYYREKNEFSHNISCDNNIVLKSLTYPNNQDKVSNVILFDSTLFSRQTKNFKLSEFGIVESDFIHLYINEYLNKISNRLKLNQSDKIKMERVLKNSLLRYRKILFLSASNIDNNVELKLEDIKVDLIKEIVSILSVSQFDKFANDKYLSSFNFFKYY